ncbi:MAG TPA: hypothetical protein DEP72_02640 [Clostridiales bacterium]|nr:MAG: hypothetical protein A2Y18_06475 [Clostridiales bacterium GWD2_32_19]HCC07052.1 hypothetical protein [Clostridiales bacterium]
MKIGIIGPNRAPHLDEDGLLLRKNKLRLMAEIVAKSGFEILLTPDKGSLLESFGEEYKLKGGQKIYEIVPLDDEYEEYLNTGLGEIISCSTWSNQPVKFNQECDVMFCVGFSAMVLPEIGFSCYCNPKPIYVIEDFISTKLPEEIRLDIKYIQFGDVKGILEKLKAEEIK